jgi:hypothetical protein
MKYFLFLIISMTVIAADESTVTLNSAKPVAEYNRKTGKITILKGAAPEEVYESLLSIIKNDEKSLSECHSQQSKPKK